MKPKAIGFLLILIILLIPSIYSLLQPGFFQTDDGEWMVIRFSAFYQALSDGQFPVRFLGRLNFGYGYPVANFLYPGFMYMATPLQILGFGFVNSVKLILILSMLGGGVFAFAWLSKLFDRTSAFIGALFFTYTPYHIFDLYKRGSVGEVLSIGILPFIFWQIERKSVFWIAIGVFLLILAHNTLAALFLILILGYMFLNVYVSQLKNELISKYLAAALIGLGMASFFWIPAFYELRYTFFSNTQISQWASYFADIELIGLSTFAIFASIFILIIFKKIEIKKHRLTVLFLVTGLSSAFLATSVSSQVWNFLPTSFIQFPFRILSLLVPSIAFLAACAVSVIKGRNKTILAGVFVVLAFASSLPFLSPKETFDKGEGFYSTNEATTTVKDEYMPRWIIQKPDKRFVEKVEILEGDGKIEDLAYNSKNISLDVVSVNGGVVRMNTIYYPGWKAKIDGQDILIDFGNERGVIDVKVPPGRSSLEVYFTETPVRLASDAISILAFFILIFWSSKGIIKTKLARQKNG